MKTPICDFVTEYKNSKKLRLHMPGHKGSPFLGIEEYDITEISGADVLYDAKGIIRESEENAAKLFGTKKTVYSAEGSSLSIRAMLYLAMLYAKANGRKPLIAAGRNAHRVFMTAAALLDFETEWIFPQKSENIISCEISPEYLDSFLSDMSEKPAAVYITSPDYLGNIADIKGLSDVCKKYGSLLLVDNAHGAYLNFLPEKRENFIAAVPKAGKYQEVFNSDSIEFGGKGNINTGVLKSQPCDLPRNYKHAVSITLPPMGAVVLKKCRVKSEECRVKGEGRKANE